MTIGEKITKLRTDAGMSQELLAEKLEVSRQSVSKWELDGAQPTIDKVILLSRIFGVTTDELLVGELSVNKGAPDAEGKNKYFGTDGFRGEANADLTAMHAFKVGRFLGWYYA